MKSTTLAVLGGLLLLTTPLLAQDDGGGASEIVVTAMRRVNGGISGAVVVQSPPVIGLRKRADSAVRDIEIISDSRDGAMRKREVQAMLLDALDRANKAGFSLVTGQYELVEVTRANWQDQFPGFVDKDKSADDEDEDYDDDERDGQSKPSFEDDGSFTRIRLKIKTRLDGSISAAQQKITTFIKSVPATGRSLIEQRGQLALTIINPQQYRDEIYRRIAAGAKHAVSFYGQGFGLDISGLDQAIAWKQVSDTELFLYIPYSFTVKGMVGNSGASVPEGSEAN